MTTQLAGERAFTLGIPSQGLIVLALLRCLEAAGGTATPAQIYDQVAQEVGVAAEARTATVTWAGEARNVFERQVRHAYQFTKGKGLTETPTRGEWSLRHYLLGGGGRFPAPRFFPAAYGFPGEPV
jgi:hypothetical protein